MEEKEWDPSKGDFQKRSVHQEHQHFKKKAKRDKILVYFFVIIIIGVIIIAINGFHI